MMTPSIKFEPSTREILDSGVFTSAGHVDVTSASHVDIKSYIEHDHRELAAALNGISIAVDGVTTTLSRLLEKTKHASRQVRVMSVQDIREEIKRTEAQIKAITAPADPDCILALHAASAFAAHGIDPEHGFKNLQDEYLRTDNRLPFLEENLASLQSQLAEREAAEAGQALTQNSNTKNLLHAVQSFLSHVYDAFGKPGDFQWATQGHVLDYIVTCVDRKKSIHTTMPAMASADHIKELESHLARMDIELQKVGVLLAKRGDMPQSAKAVADFRETWVAQFRAALTSDLGSASTPSASPSKPIIGSIGGAPSGSTLAPL